MSAGFEEGDKHGERPPLKDPISDYCPLATKLG